MRVFQFFAVLTLVASCFSGVSRADLTSSVWTTGIDAGDPGAFGTPGSVSDNSISAAIESANVTLTNITPEASNSWFRTDGNPLGTNEQLVPFLENDAPLTTLSFTSDQALNNFDLLVHNVWYSSDPDNQNFIGNFEVHYENGTIITNATPQLRSINDDSPFDIDTLGGTTQPEGLDDAFDGNNLLSVSAPNFDPGNGAPLATYLFDESQSTASEQQGSAIISFDESAHGGIERVDFTWVGNTVGVNTAFIGFAGATELVVVAVPEPSSIAILAIGSGLGLLRRRRKIA